MTGRLLSRLAGAPVVAVLRGLGPDEAVQTAMAAVAGGVRVVELTMDSPDAAEGLFALVRSLPPDVAVGAGTVVAVRSLELAVEADAQFAMSPHLDVDLLRMAAAAGLEMVPGVATPTELAAAVGAGARLVKLFPAAAMGPNWIRAAAGPYSSVQIIATGGIRPDDAQDWLAAGAVAVGLGSELVRAAPEEVTRRCRHLLQRLQ